MNEIPFHSKTWMKYQKRLRREARINYYLRRLPWLGIYGIAIFALLASTFFSVYWIFTRLGKAPGQEIRNRHQPPTRPWSKKDLVLFLKGMNLDLTKEPDPLPVTKNGRRFLVETSIDPSLQAYMEKLLRRSLTLQAAAVVLRPKTGQILAMAQYPGKEGGNGENLCLKAEFPAASLFKIVSAAAAIETRGFSPETTLSYRGRRYTLYKSQLKRREGRYSNKVTFERAFSKSINPVFGKIGIYELGRDVLADYANRFLFNLEIPFEFPLEESKVKIPEDDFGLAEIASGFNKKTLISPLHAALLAAIVANGGTVMEPWVIRWVRDDQQHLLYHAAVRKIARVIEASTARRMKSLMAETVKTGTCRKAFLPLTRKKKFKGLELGAKTGTINDRNDRFKYDWLSAYAVSANGNDGICVAVLAVHGKKLGIRAKDLGREIIRHYFTS